MKSPAQEAVAARAQGVAWEDAEEAGAVSGPETAAEPELAAVVVEEQAQAEMVAAGSESEAGAAGKDAPGRMVAATSRSARARTPVE